ncbi:MAG: YidC/Oxa1 family membrane protein insertase [Bacilli bacterium]|nr:YidC/Oxa1 family membrane protein insertase [Bacilli bacterium]
MKKNRVKILILFLLVLLLTGCTTVLKDNKTKKAVYYETNDVKITLYENILCQPTDKGLIKKYKKYKKQIDISKIPTCEKFEINDSNYEGLWENLLVKPLAWLLVNANKFIKNYGLTIVLLGLVIRLLLAPFTQKTAMQSEAMKEIQPEMDRINKKYEGRDDQASQQQKSLETMQLYKKYKINPFSSCLFAFIQIPLLMAFYEAVNRVPVIFEGKSFGLILGTTPLKAITGGSWIYIVIPALIVITTFVSQKLNKTAPTPQKGDINPNIMSNMMIIMIAVMSINFSVALSLYWIASTLFTIVQNLIAMQIKKKKKAND